MIAVPAYTADQVRAAERPLLDAGVPLMRRAASALAAITRDRVARSARPALLVLAGSGDNGGDALYAAAELSSAADVEVLPVGRRVHEAALAEALSAGCRAASLRDVTSKPTAYDVVLDGILGIGASAGSGLRGDARDAVAALLPRVQNGSLAVIAVDLPSGLDPGSGTAVDPVLPAGTTVTFGAVKAGIVRGRGPELCGDVVLVDLGLEALHVADAVAEASVSRIVSAQSP
ncbi:NAD(P)H-hydrate epimerase [Microbacterium sp. NPDC057407]|uniref:NAD(P)H-hydrate epimerase n=1 Tax=Microbacterium sp. NPDC057407 TaxID=3346120 RepID=UPI0036706079